MYINLYDISSNQFEVGTSQYNYTGNSYYWRYTKNP